MPARTFARILQDAVSKKLLPTYTTTSREWLRTTASSISKMNVPTLVKEAKSSMTNKVLLGHLYMFMYEAKHEETLPYYDQFPVIFPFKMAPGGFYGLNMHYLPHMLRAKLMDGLYGTISDENYNDETKLRFTYNLLNSAARFKYFEPCVKRYLTSHMKTRFIHVHPTQWELGLFLPLERFVGENKQKVWQDSRKKIGR